MAVGIITTLSPERGSHQLPLRPSLAETTQSPIKRKLSTNRKGPENNQSNDPRRQRRLAVSFDVDHQVNVVAMPDAEEVWLTEADFRRFRKDRRQAIRDARQVLDFGNFETEEQTCWGVELLIDKIGETEKQLCRAEAWDVVIGEQERQVREGINDPVLIAELLTDVTSPCALNATKLARHYTKDRVLKNYLHSTRIELQQRQKLLREKGPSKVDSKNVAKSVFRFFRASSNHSQRGAGTA